MHHRTLFVTSTFNPFRIAAVAVLVATAGCASAPSDAPGLIPESTIATTSIEGVGKEIIGRDRIAEKSTIVADADLVWGVLGGVYEQIGIPVTSVDSQIMMVGNLGYEARRIDGIRMNTYLDCGTNFNGPLANHYQVTLAVTTRLAKVDATHTEVSTVVDGSAKPRTTAGYPVSCTTRQKLEALIAKKLEEALGLES